MFKSPPGNSRRQKNGRPQAEEKMIPMIDPALHGAMRSFRRSPARPFRIRSRPSLAENFPRRF
jgi:hypothetical protein